MTIKRRLYLSNILMIGMPIFLSLFILGLFFWGFTHFFGKDFYQQWERNESYDQMFEDVEELSNKWDEKKFSTEEITVSLKGLVDEHPTEPISIFVYNNHQKLLVKQGGATDQSLIDKLLAQPDVHTLLINDTLFRSFRQGDYHTIVMSQDYRIDLTEEVSDNKPLIVLLILIVVTSLLLAITLTNFILARFVFRPIKNSLDILSYGVDQISCGNLSWRIDYPRQDEFQPVVTDFNEMADRLEKMVTEQQNNSENRKELIAGISHDLRTPLTSIKAYVEGLEKGVASTFEMKQQYLRTIAQKSDELEHIVAQLFTFSKMDLGEFPFYNEEVNIGEFLTHFVQEIRNEYLQKGLTISLTGTTLTGHVLVDQVQLKNVLLNIVENTVKYGNQSQNQLWITQSIRENQAVIELIDNGPGIEDADSQRLFDVFYRGDKARTQPNKGSGLGLAISKKIIEQLAGKITAKNSDKGGLLMTIELPLSNKK